MRKTGKKKGGRFYLALLVLFLISVAAALWYLKTGEKEEAPKIAKIEKPVIEKPFERKPSYRVAIVIDDMGNDMNIFRGFLASGVPITVAVLPELQHSKEVAEEAHKKGLEVLLHLPMEPKDLAGHNPGKGALLTGMGEDEIRELFRSGLGGVPYVSGFNNHMGSKFTENPFLMKTVLEEAKEKNLFYLDSLTTEHSVGVKVAKELGLKAGRRNVFLDNTRDKEYIKGQVRELLAIAKKRGKAIAIGHPYSETLEALKEEFPGMGNEGIEVVRVSELLE